MASVSSSKRKASSASEDSKAPKQKKQDAPTEKKKKRKGGLDDQPEPQEAAQKVMDVIKDMQKTIKEGWPKEMAAESFKMSVLFIMKDLFLAGAMYANEKAAEGEDA